MKQPIFLTVVITAYNEEGNILRCLELMDSFLQEQVEQYEIILVNDGSTDDTAREAAKFSSAHLKVIHQPFNQGTGAGVKAALKIAQGDWYCWFPSDLEILPQELAAPIQTTTDQDVVVTYFTNGSLVRTKFRHVLSEAFIKILNFTFSQRVRYFNGISLIRRELIDISSIKANGFFFHAELLLKTLARTGKYTEVPMRLSPRHSGKPKAMKLKVLMDVLACYGRIFWELKVKG